MQDLGIYNAYKMMKRRQGLIDEAIDNDANGLQEDVEISVDNNSIVGGGSNVNPEEYKKYHELVKKLQVKTKQDGDKS